MSVSVLCLTLASVACLVGCGTSSRPAEPSGCAVRELANDQATLAVAMVAATELVDSIDVEVADAGVK